MNSRLYIMTLLRNRPAGRRRHKYAKLDSDVLHAAVRADGDERMQIRLIAANLFQTSFDEMEWPQLRFTILPGFEDRSFFGHRARRRP